MRALLALVLVSGCIWVTDDELMEPLVLQDEDVGWALADVYAERIAMIKMFPFIRVC